MNKDIDMRIRKAGPSDREQLMVIWLEGSRAGHAFLGEERLRAQYPVVRENYLPNADNWLAEDDQQLLGFIGLIGSHVGGLFVIPHAHRRGVGRALIDHAAARKGELGVEVYEANAGAVAFYRRCGFQLVGRKALDDEGRPFPLLCMRRPG